MSIRARRPGTQTPLDCTGFTHGNPDFSSAIVACIESAVATGGGVEVRVSIENRPRQGGGIDADFNIEASAGGTVDETDIHVVAGSSEARTLSLPASAGDQIDVAVKIIDITMDESKWETHSLTATASGDGSGGGGGGGGSGDRRRLPMIVAGAGALAAAIGVVGIALGEDDEKR